jgi:hypothetical protein
MPNIGYPWVSPILVPSEAGNDWKHQLLKQTTDVVLDDDCIKSFARAYLSGNSPGEPTAYIS